ncbi:MAG: MBOAT family protein, partial [Firmicutes bacterium]|nr:MBOAT family protein [Bacillota bacterium]
GPIVRYSDVEQEIGVRYENAEEISGGIKRFIAGLAKKVIIANGVAKIAELVYAGGPESFGRLGYWLAALAYTLQIYFDFSGYSDMAIGLGRIFGFHFPENFDHPYISTSVTEFWRRWHISLSSWFRDYIYIPLGGNRVGRGRWIFNIMAVWTLTGLWHGASWNFILWGLYYGLILLFEKLVLGKLLSKLPKIFGWVYTMFVVVIGWVLFDISDFAQLSAALTAMFKGPLIPAADMVAADVRIAMALIYVPLGLIFMFPVGRLFRNFEKRNAGLIVSDMFFAALLVLCVAVLISDSYNPFIYFRF